MGLVPAETGKSGIQRLLSLNTQYQYSHSHHRDFKAITILLHRKSKGGWGLDINVTLLEGWYLLLITTLSTAWPPSAGLPAPMVTTESNW